MTLRPTLIASPASSQSPASSVEGPGWFESPSARPTARRDGTTYLEAIRAALEDAMVADERVVLLGEDIGTMGGAFRVTAGLLERFGDERVIDTPMAETALVGAAVGMAAAGMRPVVELQFADFISCAYDQLVTEAAKLHYRFGIAVPLVVRAPAGAGVGAGPFHSQSPEGIFAHVPGLKVVCPATPQDAYDLLLAAVADPNPVLYFEHKALYRSCRAELQRRPPEVGLGTAAIRRRGEHVTVVTYGAMVRRCLEAATVLAERGIEAEVVDLRTVAPLDLEACVASLRRTARLVIVHEDTHTLGVGAEIAARVGETAFFDLDAPVVRVTAPDAPVPFSAPLEDAYVPSVARIMEGIERCLAA